MAEPSDSLAAAIKRKWDTSSRLRSLIPKGFLEEVPERDENDKLIDLPYAWFDVGRSRYEWTFETYYHEHNVVDFHAYAAGAAAVEAIGEALFDEYAWKTLPFFEATTIAFIPTDSDLKSEMLRYRGGQVIYRVTHTFEAVVARHHK